MIFIKKLFLPLSPGFPEKMSVFLIRVPFSQKDIFLGQPVNVHLDYASIHINLRLREILWYTILYYQGRPKGVQKTQNYLNMLMRKSKLPARTISLQSNTFFHMGAFILPFDGGIMNQFTCYFVKDTEFTGGKAKINCAKFDFLPATFFL